MNKIKIKIFQKRQKKKFWSPIFSRIKIQKNLLRNQGKFFRKLLAKYLEKFEKTGALLKGR